MPIVPSSDFHPSVTTNLSRLRRWLISAAMWCGLTGRTRPPSALPLLCLTFTPEDSPLTPSSPSLSHFLSFYFSLQTATQTFLTKQTWKLRNDKAITCFLYFSAKRCPALGWCTVRASGWCVLYALHTPSCFSYTNSIAALSLLYQYLPVFTWGFLSFVCVCVCCWIMNWPQDFKSCKELRTCVIQAINVIQQFIKRQNAALLLAQEWCLQLCSSFHWWV